MSGGVVLRTTGAHSAYAARLPLTLSLSKGERDNTSADGDDFGRNYPPQAERHRAIV
jgi:hypothetical protein